MRELPTGKFYGAVGRRLACDGLIVSEIIHRQPAMLPAHGHTNAFLTIVLDGHYTERFAHKVISFRPGFMSLHQAGVEHQDQIEDCGSTLLCAEMTSAWVEHSFGSPSFTDDFYCPVPAGYLIRRLNALLGLRGLEGITQELLIEIIDAARLNRGRALRSSPPVFQRAREMLHDRLADNLTIQDLAQELGTHPVHLSRIFTQKTGRTLGEYLHRIRIETAARRIVETDEPLVEIALSCGFFDQSHFTRVFKQATGLAPGRWRKVQRA